MSIHEGHRQRLKKRFRSEGLDNFNEIQALELLLFYCVPRQDTNPLAHKLLARFGSFCGVLDASAAEMEKIPGIGENISGFFTLLRSSWRYYLINQSNREKIQILDSAERCGEYLRPRFDGKKNETVYMLCLDAKCKLLACEEIGEGSINSAAIPIRRVVEITMASNASSVVIAHNHPSGLAIPSDEDILTTKRLDQTLRSVDVGLEDHIVFADGDFTSMVQSRFFVPGETRMYL